MEKLMNETWQKFWLPSSLHSSQFDLIMLLVMRRLPIMKMFVLSASLQASFTSNFYTEI